MYFVVFEWECVECAAAVYDQVVSFEEGARVFDNVGVHAGGVCAVGAGQYPGLPSEPFTYVMGYYVDAFAAAMDQPWLVFSV